MGPALGNRELQVHPGLLVAGDRAVEVVRAGLESDLQRLRLARVVDGRLLVVDSRPDNDEIVPELARVLRLEVVAAGLQRRSARESDLEFRLINDYGLRARGALRCLRGILVPGLRLLALAAEHD